MFRKISKNVSIHKLVSMLLAAVILCGLLPALSTQASAADRMVYYPVDFSDDMLRSGVGQKIAKDCQFVTVVTMEAYMAGAVSDKEKDTVYTAVKNANPGSTSGKPNAEVIQSPNWGKTIGYEDMTYSLENLYREISRGNPVMIYRAGTAKKSPHWSVVCGYTGSATKLEESGLPQRREQDRSEVLEKRPEDHRLQAEDLRRCDHHPPGDPVLCGPSGDRAG